MKRFGEFLLEARNISPDELEQLKRDVLAWLKKDDNQEIIDSIAKEHKFESKYIPHSVLSIASGKLSVRDKDGQQAPMSDITSAEGKFNHKLFDTDIESWKMSSLVYPFFIWWVSDSKRSKNAFIYGSSKSEGKLGNATDLFEQFASIGLTLSEYEEMIPSELLDLYNKSNTKISRDKNEYDLDNMTFYQKDLNAILQGSYYFRNTAPFNKYIPNLKKIEHSGISSYYSNLRSITDEEVQRYAIPEQKDNTADIAVFGGNAESLYSNGENKIEPSEDGGVLWVNGNKDDWIIQISLKATKSGSQGGKVGKIYKDEKIYDAKTKSKVIDTYYTSTSDFDALTPEEKSKLFQELGIEEGWIRDSFSKVFDYLKKSISWLNSKLQGILGKLSQLTNSLLKHLSNRAIISGVDKKIAEYSRSIPMSLQDSYLMEKASATEKVNAIKDSVTAKTRLTQDLNVLYSEVRTLVPNKSEWRSYFTDPLNVNDVDNITDDDVRYLLANMVSFEVLETYYKKISSNKVLSLYESAIHMATGIIVNTLMGESVLPVVKLYGTKKNEAEYEVLDRDEYDKQRDEALSLDVSKKPLAGGLIIARSIQSGVKTSKSGGYYSITQFTFAGLDKNKNSLYNKIQLRTAGSGSGFQYNIESQGIIDGIEYIKLIDNASSGVDTK